MRLLTGELGFDAAVNYRADDFRDDFKAATRRRHRHLLRQHRRRHPRRRACAGCDRTAASCAAAWCPSTTPPTRSPGPRGIPGLLVNNRVRMEGFLVFDFADRYDEAAAQMRAGSTAASSCRCTTRSRAWSRRREAFVDLLAGGNIGTRIVRVAD